MKLSLHRLRDSLGRAGSEWGPSLTPWLSSAARRGYFDLHGPFPARAPRRVLLLAGHWLGDTFWAAQTVAPLQARFPEAVIWVATRARVRDLWSGSIPEGRVLLCPDLVSDRRREPFRWAGLRRTAARLRALRPDLVLDLMGNHYSALVSFAAGPQRAYGCAPNALDWLYSRPIPPRPTDAHLAARPFVALSRLGISSPPAPRPLPLPESEPGALLSAEGLAPSAPYAVLAPGAGWASKRWPAPRFAALAAGLEASGLQVLALGSAGERALLDEVLAGTRHGAALCGLSIPASVGLLRSARLVVGNDSGLGHLAAAEGTPTLALFSPTNPLRYRPLGPRVRVLQGDCPSRPAGTQEHCHQRPGFACPMSCWDALSVERVLAAAQDALTGA